MKRHLMILVSLLTLIGLMFAVTPTAFAASDLDAAKTHSRDEFRYPEWSFSEDFTKVTVGSKTYDNVIFIIRDQGVRTVINLAHFYLMDPAVQASMTPEAFFVTLKDVATVFLGKVGASFPETEVISINGEPWQATAYASIYADALNPTYAERARSFYINVNNNGYADEVLAQGMTIDAARAQSPLAQEVLVVPKYAAFRGSAEFYQAGGSVYAANAAETVALKFMDFPTTLTLERITRTTKMVLNDVRVLFTEGVGARAISAINFDLPVAPVAPNGYTLIPVRGVFEAFGATVTWLDATQQVVIEDGSNVVTLTLGSDTALVNNHEVKMPQVAVLMNSRTMIPLRFISENLGYEVGWDGASQTITITK